ncbi:MAG: hypothetical protein WBF24_08080 [Xanthobacteraceae bacterium]
MFPWNLSVTIASPSIRNERLGSIVTAATASGNASRQETDQVFFHCQLTDGVCVDRILVFFMCPYKPTAVQLERLGL